MTDYKRLRSLFFEINEILDNAPEEYECLDEEKDVYEEMKNLK